MNTNDYLIKLKPENDCVIAYLKEINESFMKMKEETIYYLIDTNLSVNEKTIQYNKDISEINDFLNQQDQHIKQLLLINEKIRSKIRCICNHVWFKDSIDIDPDRSKTIEYCKLCELSR
jgi:formyltetrahydrofolate synthetase